MKKTCLIFFLFVFQATAFGQDQDVRLWSSLSVRYDLSKKWRISLEEEARFIENIGRLDKINSELTVNYQINKFLDGGVLYRLIANNHPDGYVYANHRFGAYLEVQKKYAGMRLSLKTSFQKTYPAFFRSGDWYLPENYVRAEGGVSRELKNKKTEPYTNLEWWYRIQSGDQSFIDRYRFTIGIKHKLNKNNRLDLFFRVQQELQVKDPLTAWIFGVGYQFKVR